MSGTRNRKTGESDERGERRRRRLGEALRENLRRRKKQARARRSGTPDEGDGGPPAR